MIKVKKHKADKLAHLLNRVIDPIADRHRYDIKNLIENWDNIWTPLGDSVAFIALIKKGGGKSWGKGSEGKEKRFNDAFDDESIDEFERLNNLKYHSADGTEYLEADFDEYAANIRNSKNNNLNSNNLNNAAVNGAYKNKPTIKKYGNKMFSHQFKNNNVDDGGNFTDKNTLNKEVKNILLVQVASSAVSFELKARENIIIEKINSVFGYKAVDNISVRLGKVAKASNSDFMPISESEILRAVEGLSDNEISEINPNISDIEDDNLKKSLLKLKLLMSKSRRRHD